MPAEAPRQQLLLGSLSRFNALAILGKRTGKAEPLREALKIRAAIMLDVIATGDDEGFEQGLRDAMEDIKLLHATGDLATWIEENAATWAEIDHRVVGFGRYLLARKEGQAGAAAATTTNRNTGSRASPMA